jgi:hypothetical protein
MECKNVFTKRRQDAEKTTQVAALLRLFAKGILE